MRIRLRICPYATRVQQQASTARAGIVLIYRKQTRRGGREAEGGGLLILPALFVLTDFQVFCST